MILFSAFMFPGHLVAEDYHEDGYMRPNIFMIGYDQASSRELREPGFNFCLNSYLDIHSRSGFNLPKRFCFSFLPHLRRAAISPHTTAMSLMLYQNPPAWGVIPNDCVSSYSDTI